MRRCNNYPPVSNFQSPVMGSRHGQCMVNAHSPNLHQGKHNNFVVSHGHEDMQQALQKVYLEALLAQQNQQFNNSSPLFGRSGSLNHLYGNHTYNHAHGISPYQGNLLENHTRGSRQLSQQERSLQFGPGSWNHGGGDVSLDRRCVSSLLDELKNNKNKAYELSDVVDHVIEFRYAN